MRQSTTTFLCLLLLFNPFKTVTSTWQESLSSLGNNLPKDKFAFCATAAALAIGGYCYYKYGSRSMPIIIQSFVEGQTVEEGYFKTEDSLRIHYRFIKHSGATSTIIVAGGCYPGNKDEALPIINVLPTSCNVLFFDARGRGKSDRAFLGLVRTASREYGVNERKDIIAAIKFNHEKTKLPCILLGLCAGAYNNAQAMLALGSDEIKRLNVIGAIFDSGWGSVEAALSASAKSNFHDVLLSCLKILFFNEKTVKSSRLWRMFTSGIDVGYDVIHHCIFKPLINKKSTTITDKIKNISVPMLFIHSNDDQETPIKMAQELANNAQKECTQCWWIDQESKHTQHYAKHPDVYQEKVAHFIELALKQN